MVDGSESRYFRIHYATTVQTTLSLLTGWNLVSVPIKPVQPNIYHLLTEGASYSPVYSGAVWGWKNGQYYKSTEIKPSRGYWIYCESPADIHIEGFSLAGTSEGGYTVDNDGHFSLDLAQGWNLIGPVVGGEQVEYPLTSPLWGTIWHWDGNENISTGILELSKGYWVYSLQAGSIDDF